MTLEIEYIVLTTWPTLKLRDEETFYDLILYDYSILNI